MFQTCSGRLYPTTILLGDELTFYWEMYNTKLWCRVTLNIPQREIGGDAITYENNT